MKKTESGGLLTFLVRLLVLVGTKGTQWILTSGIGSTTLERLQGISNPRLHISAESSVHLSYHTYRRMPIATDDPPAHIIVVGSYWYNAKRDILWYRVRDWNSQQIYWRGDRFASKVVPDFKDLRELMGYRHGALTRIADYLVTYSHPKVALKDLNYA
jgi:hypothetical protein